ncbi:putative V-type H [Monocercomonoides exilis]|uniref:putative V-type H n=1 Tax=Monocercomonoides exilis TaxID=2049356 RepID=UPI003559BBE0|nr:putative V-type H [Monocercomonoides exilis]|eukprot:MONOS_7764.1-p1 / transcript=MONOS_7764.1 / gene=MONOS_7764 / organism=Monocercomonoides_exilis_PA203 / gene_product=V-type H / transcript_product=V-type H / location=Mono_scaffold00274:21152-23745(+) / protein_length=697 / sequence_SO=supercontig / SO=protein_coding / is_pseudo=false
MNSTDSWIWGFIAMVMVVCLGCCFYIYWLFKWVMRHDEGPKEMKAVSDPIREGAFGFLKTQYTTITAFAVPVAVIIFCIYLFVPGSTAGIETYDGKEFSRVVMGLISAIAFCLGALCSGLSGWFGMWVSVRTNVRCAAAVMISSNEAIKVAFRGGSFSGMLIVTLSLFGVTTMFAFVHAFFPNVKLSVLSNVIVGYGFGASFVALFAQLGGGIYTKAADVGCDLVGKVNNDIPEDDPRNPAVIADLVGDNVGDCAGRGADLFESTAAENIGAMVIGGTVAALHKFEGRSMAGYVLFPLVVRSFGLLSSMIGILCVYSKEGPKKEAPAAPKAGESSSAEATSAFGSYADIESLEAQAEDPMYGLLRGFGVTAALCAVGIYLVSYLCLHHPSYPNAWWAFGTCGLIGIGISLLFVFITQYYTDYRFRPVKSIAKASETGHATNIIAGMAVGMESTCLPVLVICAAIVGCYYLGDFCIPGAGFFGTASGTMGMLMVVAFVLGMDTFGPISDNAGGVVEMSMQPEHIRARTDRLDAVGNTTKALTKGYAPGIMNYTEQPDYQHCVAIVTKAALKEMIRPALLIILTPIVLGLTFRLIGSGRDNILGARVLGSMLMVATMTGVLVGLFLNNAGGAWDNSKKFIEMGNYGGKGSDAHKASVTGDTVGDPCKDTAGPSIHVLIKLLSTITLVLAPIFVKPKTVA